MPPKRSGSRPAAAPLSSPRVAAIKQEDEEMRRPQRSVSGREMYTADPRRQTRTLAVLSVTQFIQICTCALPHPRARSANTLADRPCVARAGTS